MLAELRAVQEEDEARLLGSRGSKEYRGVNTSGCRREQCQRAPELFGRESQGSRTCCFGVITAQWMSRWSKGQK